MSSPGQSQSVSVAELPANFEESAVLLDVRENDEWQAGHAPEAVHVPMSELPGRLADIDIDATLYVVCKVGGRSQQVVDYLNRIGYDAINVDGGMLAWHAAGRPVRTAQSDDGTII